MVPGYDQRQARTGLAGLTKPDPKERAAQIVAWAICWPWNIVWTFCVYNPLRYVGEFLLKELYSALFEISRGQFSSIEQDLSLDSPAPLYPAPKKQPPENDAAHATAVSVEITNVAAQPAITDVEQPDTEATTAEPTTEATSSAPSIAETATETTTVEFAEPEVAKSSDPQEQTATPVTLELPEEEQPEEPIEGLPAESELAEGGSSDSYTWAPPEPTAYVPLSDRPLKAVKYEAGSARPVNLPQKPAPTEPAADPWFEKHAPKQ